MINRRRFIHSAGATGAGLAVAAELGGSLWSGVSAAEDAHAAPPTPGATVKTRAGRIRGTLQGKVHAFRGIPYGATTAGAGRFNPPAKPVSWSGVRDAFVLGPRAPQLDSGFKGQIIHEVEVTSPLEPMGEDCLCLNLWTAGLSGADRRPVMVWLHGGGYTTGSGGFSIYDGQELARNHGVVVVTVNHRLTSLGYLYLEGVGGARWAGATNVGNLDIIAALQWVHENVAAFGGDPANVTIFGQSGGGGKVSSLMAMPAAKGLFHRAIVQSGAAVKGLSPEAATRTAQSYLNQLGVKPDHLEDLRTMSYEQLLAPTGGGGPPLNFAPVVDGRTLPADPFDPVAPALSAHVPLLIGSVETEVTFFARQTLEPMEADELHQRVQQSLRGLSSAQVDQLLAAYRAGRPAASNTDLYLIIASDLFRGGVLTETERKAQQAAAPVYSYYFTWRSPVRDGLLRTFHTLEIPFVFDNVETGVPMMGSGEAQRVLATKMSSAWAAFARSGNPACPELPAWAPFDTKRRATMIFDNVCQVVDDPHGPELQLLKQLQQGA